MTKEFSILKNQLQTFMETSLNKRNFDSDTD